MEDRKQKRVNIRDWKKKRKEATNGVPKGKVCLNSWTNDMSLWSIEC